MRQFEGAKYTERLLSLSEQGISAIYLVFFDLPDNLTVAHDPYEQLCYGQRRQSHASDGRHRCQHPSTFALTRPRECQRHHEGSTPPCRRFWTCRRASAQDSIRASICNRSQNTTRLKNITKESRNVLKPINKLNQYSK